MKGSRPENVGNKTMFRSCSVIVCTHNPREDYLRRTLAALEAQTLARDRWELLLVDNASRERLALVWDISWHPHARHVREDQLGLTNARLRGINEARGDIFVFVDDDNLLKPDFLERLEIISSRNPHLGVLGPGMVEPEFEIQPSPDIVAFSSMLALRAVESSIWSNNPHDRTCMPWGAGLCATREIAEKYVSLVQQLNVSKILGRRGKELFCAEDDLFSWVCAIMDKGFGIFPELRVIHLISAQRLTRAYFLRLTHDWSLSHAVLHYLLQSSKPRRIDLEQSARILLGGVKNGLFHMRCKLAGARGEQKAWRFISDNQLQPLDELPLAGHPKAT